MNVNWKVRLMSKTFWVTIIPLIVLLIQLVAGFFGFTVDLGETGNKIIGIVDVVFAILAAIGIVTDHTTKGFSDSERALTYDKPNDDSNELINGKHYRE